MNVPRAMAYKIYIYSVSGQPDGVSSASASLQPNLPTRPRSLRQNLDGHLYEFES